VTRGFGLRKISFSMRIVDPFACTRSTWRNRREGSFVEGAIVNTYGFSWLVSHTCSQGLRVFHIFAKVIKPISHQTVDAVPPLPHCKGYITLILGNQELLSGLTYQIKRETPQPHCACPVFISLLCRQWNASFFGLVIYDDVKFAKIHHNLNGSTYTAVNDT
jgi:hypothetical protein